MNNKKFFFSNQSGFNTTIDISVVETTKGNVRTIDISNGLVTMDNPNIIIPVNDYDTTSINKNHLIRMCEYLLDELKK